MKVQQIALSKLKPAKYNPRKISKGQLSSLERSIVEFGVVEAIVANKDGTVISGHQRLKIAKKLKMKTVPVCEVDLSKKKEKALNVAMNRIGGEFDDELLAGLLKSLDSESINISGFSDDEFEKLLREFEPEILDEFSLPDGDRTPFQQVTFTLHDRQVVDVKKALKVSKGMGKFNTKNENSNGNALARICKSFIKENA